MMRIKRKKSIGFRISILLLRLLKQLPWSAWSACSACSAHTYTYVYASLHVFIIEFMLIIFRLIKRDNGPGDPHNHNHHNRGKKAHESSSLSLKEQRDMMKIIGFIGFIRCVLRYQFETGLQSIDINIDSKNNWRHKAINIATAADKCKLKIKVPAPYPCVGVGDRRRSASASVSASASASASGSGSGSVMKVIKGLNFYLFSISILPAYLNLRRAKKFDQIITFLYFYLFLKGISTGDFSGVLMELFPFSIEDDHQEGETPIPYRNLLMILKRPGLSNEPFRVIGIIGVFGDCDLGFRDDLAIKFSQTKPQTCWGHRAVNANVNVNVYLLDSIPESVQPLTLTPKIIHEIYLSPTIDEELKVFGKFTEIFEAKYTESTTPPLTTFISPISIYIYPVTAYISQSRNLILTMTYNFDMFKWRVNPMDMIDSAKPLLIMIKSIITIVRKAFPYTALRSDIPR